MSTFRLLKLTLLLAMTLCFAALPVSAIQPLQTAVLPVVNTANYRYPDEVQIIQTTLKTPFKYPYYSLIPADTVQKAVSTYLTQHPSSRLTEEKSLAQIANTLSADLVVVVELSNARLDTLTTFWDEETYVQSDIVLKGYAYSSLLKKYDIIKVVKYEREPMSVDTNTYVMFKDLTEQILAKLPYKRIPLAGFAKPELSADEDTLPH